MEKDANNIDQNKKNENQIKDEENLPNPEATGFFTLSYKNWDKFSGQMTKAEVDSYGIYEGSNGLTFEGDFIKKMINLTIKEQKGN